MKPDLNLMFTCGNLLPRKIVVGRKADYEDGPDWVVWMIYESNVGLIEKASLDWARCRLKVFADSIAHVLGQKLAVPVEYAPEDANVV